MATRRIAHSAYARIGFEYWGAMENTDVVALPSPAEMNPFLSIPSGGGARMPTAGGLGINTNEMAVQISLR
jgi:hypothetical protein